MGLTKPFEKEAKNGVQLFFKSDLHFNENGHRVVAYELTKQYPNIIQGRQYSTEEANEPYRRP